MKIASFIAASSGSGKTTLIEKVVRILKQRGLRVAVIKHTPKGFDLERPGKDSWRFREAGADSVVLAGPDMTAVLLHAERSAQPGDLLRLAGDCDVALFEGFKQTAVNPIEVFRSGVSGERPLCMNDPTIRALASDRPLSSPCPTFDLNDAQAIADFIITKL